MKERRNGPRRELKPTIDQYRTTITINLTTIMSNRFPITNNRNRSILLLRLMDEYLDTLPDIFIKEHDHYIITITKPNPELHTRMYKAIKSGVALSRSELFRQAIMWDINRENIYKIKQIIEDKKKGVIKVPIEGGDKVYKIIGVA